MPERGFFEQKRTSPTSLAVVIVLHAAAVTALATSKMEFDVTGRTGPTVVDFIEEMKDPPPVPDPPKSNEDLRTDSRIDQPRPKIEVERPVATPFDDPIVEPFPDARQPGTELVNPVDPPLPDPPRPEPVRKDAEIDSRSNLQPPYPASEQRLEREGSVTVRVVIGSDGRVKAVEKVRATSDAFFQATEQHARRHWRFRPATVDSRPVESSKTMTVRFQLDG